MESLRPDGEGNGGAAVKLGPEAELSIILRPRSGDYPSGHFQLEHQHQEGEIFSFFEKPEDHRAGDFVRQVRHHFYLSPPFLEDRGKIKFQGISLDNFYLLHSRKTLPQAFGQSRVDLQGINFFYPLGQRSSEASEAGSNFYHHVFPLQAGLIHDLAEDVGILDKMLP